MATIRELHPKTYRVWTNMRNRCSNSNHPAYKWYGARGIKVCHRWNDFSNFYADMGEKPDNKSLDRVDNDGDYKPENCRWSTITVQNSNTRKNRYFTINGMTKTLEGWVRHSELKHSTVTMRFYVYGWSIEEALFTPLRGDKSGNS